MGLFGKKNEDEREPESEEIEEEDNTYEMEELECTNCKAMDNFDIPFGKTVKDFLKDKKCEFCGCKMGGN